MYRFPFIKFGLLPVFTATNNEAVNMLRFVFFQTHDYLAKPMMGTYSDLVQHCVLHRASTQNPDPDTTGPLLNYPWLTANVLYLS